MSAELKPFAVRGIELREARKALVMTELAESGALLIDCQSSSWNRAQLLTFAEDLGTIVMHPHGDADGITTVRDKSELQDTSAGLAGFCRSKLELHTDRSSERDPPNIVILACAEPASNGGISILSDSLPVINYMAKNHSAELDLLYSEDCYFGNARTPYRILTRTSLGTVVRFRLDNLGFYPRTMWAAIELFHQLLMRSDCRFHLRKDTMFVIDNHRVLHGRTEYSGDRTVLRAHISIQL